MVLFRFWKPVVVQSIENSRIVRSMSDNTVALAQTNRPKNCGDLAISGFRRIDILRKPLFI